MINKLYGIKTNCMTEDSFLRRENNPNREKLIEEVDFCKKLKRGGYSDDPR